MNTRSLRTLLPAIVLIATTVMVLRAADKKAEVKDADVPPPGTIKFTAAPPAVQKTFKDETKNARIDLLGKGTNDANITFYKAIVPVGSNDYIMAVAEDGTFLEKILNAGHTEIKFEECPAAVQKALRDDSKTAKIEAAEKITAGKRADYILDALIQKTMYQYMIADDGTILSKMIVIETPNDGDTPAEKAPKKK